MNTEHTNNSAKPSESENTREKHLNYLKVKYAPITVHDVNLNGTLGEIAVTHVDVLKSETKLVLQPGTYYYDTKDCPHGNYSFTLNRVVYSNHVSIASWIHMYGGLAIPTSSIVLVYRYDKATDSIEILYDKN